MDKNIPVSEDYRVIDYNGILVADNLTKPMAERLKREREPKVQVNCAVHGWAYLYGGDCVFCYSEQYDPLRI